jgi:two-component system cell cycle sensor histidine kinase/response regulator CckA
MDVNARKMSEFLKMRSWMPWMVATIGIFITLFLWFISWMDIDIKRHVHPLFGLLLPWFILLSGSGISLLLAALISSNQQSRLRLTLLDEANDQLKKEIIDRKIIEESKSKLEAAMQQGQKLQAMGTLAGGIAHDFNNLLYAINGYVTMAREDVGRDTLVYANLGKVLEASTRGQELISRILAFSRRQHHQFHELNMKAVLDSVLSLLKPTIPASVSLDMHIQDPSLKIHGNQTDLHQVFVNLINNAVDAMDGEGDVTLTMTRVLESDDYLTRFPHLPFQQNYCKIDISDNGSGMDEHVLERIFEPFYTTKEVGKGTGLGLSIVHSIIKEHQGDISVKSELGKGTTFTILLPELAATTGES